MATLLSLTALCSLQYPPPAPCLVIETTRPEPGTGFIPQPRCTWRSARNWERVQSVAELNGTGELLWAHSGPLWTKAARSLGRLRARSQELSPLRSTRVFRRRFLGLASYSGSDEPATSSLGLPPLRSTCQPLCRFMW